MQQVYLNGEIKPLSDATINVLDRGFTFGDGIYEVIPVFNRVVFRLDEHLQRLSNSLEAIYMEMPFDKKEWLNIFQSLIDSVETDEQSLYLQITRGISARDHDISLSVKPTIFVMSRPINQIDMAKGIKAITHEDIRWSYCHIKAITLLPSVLLRHIAKQAGAKEAILIQDGKVTEGAASNVFVVKSNVIYTTPETSNVLPGITRGVIIKLLKENNLNLQEVNLDKQELFDADEVWVSSSTWEIVPVTKLDDKKINDGQVGSIWQKVNAIYQEYKKNYCHS
ncbi:MAG: D-amino acid aminotransferase [Pseudomonadota bacterium]